MRNETARRRRGPARAFPDIDRVSASRIRRVLETPRPGNIPAVREMGEELELKGPFEINPWTNEPMDDGGDANGAALVQSAARAD